jgi:tetratricopeptide (TPR) repeat protein
MFTSAAGNFQFDNLAAGNYDVVVEQVGYMPATQSVDVEDSPVMGLQIDLRRIGDRGDRRDVPGGSSSKVSAHELAAPHKAQDSMQKGIRLLYDKGDFQGSIAEFQKAIQIYPDFYEAYAQIGIAYINLNDSANTEAALRKSYDLSGGKYVDACFLLAKFLSFSHRFAEAEPLARKGVELDPVSWQANEELARALLGLERYQDAEPSAVEADRLKPNQPPIQLLLADIHLKLRNLPAMLDNLNAYLKLAPTGAQADRVRQTRDQVQQALANSAAPTGQSPPQGGNPPASAAPAPATNP